MREIVNCCRTPHLTPNEHIQISIQVLEENISDRVRIEMDNVATALENKVLDSSLTVIDNQAIRRVDLAITLVNASSGRGSQTVVINPGQKIFSGNVG